MIRHYTLGIIIDDLTDEVLLVRKSRPEWQAGKYNFPGGKVEDDENVKDCMVRELIEETGIYVPEDRLRSICTIKNNGLWQVEVFAALYSSEYLHAECETDEKPYWARIDELPGDLVFDVPMLLHMALAYFKQDGNENFKYAVINYE